MTQLDYVVLAVLLVSILIGVFRGLVGEIFSLIGWVVGFFAAAQLTPQIMTWFPNLPKFAGSLIGFSSILIIVLFAMRLVSMGLSRIIKLVGLAWLNLGLGGLFGLCRGLIIVVMGTLVAGMTKLPSEPFWRNAVVREPIETMATTVKPWLPPILASYIHY